MNSFTLNSKQASVVSFLIRTTLFGISLFIVLEVFFRFVVIADNRPAYLQDPETRILLFDPAFQRRGTHTYGNPPTLGGKWILNDAGWVSPYEYFETGARTRDLIALYGDSFLVGLNTDYWHHQDTLIMQLLSDEYEIYTFAMGGMMLMQYVKLIEYTEQLYNPSIHVIYVNKGDISTSITDYSRISLYYQLSISDSGFVDDNPQNFRVNSLKRLLRRSSLLRYVQYNRNLPLGQGRGIIDPNANETEDTDTMISPREDSLFRNAAEYMLEIIRNQVDNDVVIFVGDCPRSMIYKQEPVIPIIDCRIIQDLCDSFPGFIYLDLIPVYQDAYNRQSVRFNDSNNIHWNEYGNEVVATAVAKQIEILETEGAF